MAIEKLKPGRQLYFEIHENHATAVRELLENLGYQNVEVKKDMHDKERMVRALIND